MYERHDRMKIKLLELTGEEQSFKWDVPAEWITDMFKANTEDDELEAELFREAGPLQLDVWVYRSEHDVFFRSELLGEVQCTCVRCLESVHWSIDLKFGGVFCPRSHSDLDEADDPSHYLYEGDEIDFAPTVSEHIFLNLPLNPTCEQAGLDCANGTLRDAYNQADGFEEEETDEPKIDKRWAALLDIKESMAKKNKK